MRTFARSRDFKASQEGQHLVVAVTEMQATLKRFINIKYFNRLSSST